MGNPKNRLFAGVRSTVFSLGLMLGLAMSGVSGAEAQDAPPPPTGLYEGFIVLDNGTEPFSLQFDAGGGMRLISALETVERESVGLGTWDRGEAGAVRFGYVSYREGSRWICRRFVQSSVPGTCTLIVTGDALIMPSGALSGSVVITVEDRSDGEEGYTLPAFEIEAQRRSADDLIARHN